jgi:hypothetical protein
MYGLFYFCKLLCGFFQNWNTSEFPLVLCNLLAFYRALNQFLKTLTAYFAV